MISITELEELLALKSSILKIEHLKTIDFFEITTNFLDIHNDHITLYYKEETHEKKWLNDDGYTINDLKLIGFNPESPIVNSLLNDILLRFNITFALKNNVLLMATNHKNFYQNINNFIQAILNINMLYSTSIKYEEILKEKDEIIEECAGFLKEITDKERIEE